MKAAFSNPYRNILFMVICLALIASSCSTQRKGMRKRKKRNCNCPSFSLQQKALENHIYTYAFSEV